MPLGPPYPCIAPAVRPQGEQVVSRGNAGMRLAGPPHRGTGGGRGGSWPHKEHNRAPAALEGASKAKGCARNAAFRNSETQLAGMLPRNHRRSRLHSFLRTESDGKSNVKKKGIEKRRQPKREIAAGVCREHLARREATTREEQKTDGASRPFFCSLKFAALVSCSFL